MRRSIDFKRSNNLSFGKFYLSMNHSIKMKETEKVDKILKSSLRKLRNKRVTVIVSAVGTVPKSLEKEMKNWNWK